MRKELPIGREDFKEVIENGFYYVDKTKIIADMLKKKNYVSLFPRPRRFGKSLFISMLDNFFNIEYKDTNKYLFKGLYIEKSKYYKELSSRPVININFKSLKQDNYEMLYQSFKTLISILYKQKKYIFEKLSSDDQKLYQKFINKTADDSEYQQSLYFLSSFMKNYYNKNVVILIDEYDVPIQEGYLKNYYDDIVSLIRNVFSNALKGNSNIDFGIMTGVLRVSKESLFSDLNNVKIYGIVEENYNECFGFTEEETRTLLSYYDLKLTNEVKNMYNGYNFNGISIYNPWSILNYAQDKKLISYWINTSGNGLILNLVKKTNDDIKICIEQLLSGESVVFEYNDKITYLDYNNIHSKNSILNLLFISGYVTLGEKRTSDFGKELETVKIPNEEVKYLFINILKEIFTDDYHINYEKINIFCSSVLKNNKELMETTLNSILPSMSYMDETESFYHGYMLGLFTLFLESDYIIKSNRESGKDRYDLMIKKNDNSVGMILELKITDKEDKMESVALEALNQIESKKYYEILEENKVKTIYKYAIIFKGKQCIVR